VESIRLMGRSLYRQLVPPSGLARSGATLTVLPDAEIAALPFDLLVDETGREVGESGATVIAAHSCRRKEWSAPRSALIAGAPAVDRHLAPLPESRAEAEDVASRFPGSTLLTGAEASVRNVSAAIPGADLFHFSGHGFAAAGMGGLYLADGVITSAAFQKLSLDRCRLVVLSACLAAAGESSGLTNPDSLVHAILDAGAGAVVASRWPVDSAATAALVSRFYASLNSAGDPVAALASARQQLRRETRFAHPYYWSAFQIYE
jgi:CHAT domain-containing protein